MKLHLRSYTDLEYRYIQLYESSVAHWLEGPMHGRLWDVVMLQGSYEESFIKDAM